MNAKARPFVCGRPTSKATCHFVLRQRDSGAARNVKCLDGKNTNE